MKEKLLKHSIFLSVALSVILGVAVTFLFLGEEDSLIEGFIAGLLIGIFAIYPLILLFTDITFSDWTVTLHNAEKHTPIWTEGALTVVILAVVGILGYLFLSCSRISKVPPLITVLEIAAVYLGMLQCILWIIQIIRMEAVYLYLCLFPLNCILIGIKVIRQKIMEWGKIQREESKKAGAVSGFRNRYLEWLNRHLERSSVWPAAAFLLMWPMLGIIICILILFGQRPDSAVRAWTETSDWNLSREIAPQNIYYDEHYLCTVAAGGHRKVVKPIRMGVRHGHPVIVNRQLCVANAFEQILEERMPNLHRNVRNFYDRYGFPVAKMIRSPYIADVIYIMMKPLEWIFLAVIYMTDVKPENRIAVQYLPKRTA